MITRRAFAGLAAASLPLLRNRRARAAALTPVTIVQSSISFNFVPIYIAQTAGYFKQEGIDLSVVLAGGGPKAMTGLIGGGGQFSASVLFDGMMAHRRGLTDVRALATLSLFQNPMAILTTVAKQRGITLDMPLKQRLEAMKGLRIGMTTPGATSDMFMRYLFRANGMNPDRDLQIIPLGGVSAQIAALQAGRVDGCSCLPPVDVIANTQGLTTEVLDRLKDIPLLSGVTYGTLYGLDSYNKAHPEVTNAMARALARATLLLTHDPDAAKQATRPFLKELDQATYDAAWNTYFPEMPRTLDITSDSFDKELAFEKAVLPARDDAPLKYDDVVDASFVRRAMQQVSR
ncbi:ABC transporter substrate-binding protein [Acidisphaera sp. S103]|uniref:ABC transporter substrate-binding protein n=1 Tax=Acidisphaera sp. S103 TaxID=1747223 RepID=UPI00131BCD51|nr:ABC transporter substrate-binding protein [Acidisphaera sp. S103]